MSDRFSYQLHAIELLAWGAVFGIDTGHLANRVIGVGVCEHNHIALLECGARIAEVMGLFPIDLNSEGIGQDLLELFFVKGQNGPGTLFLNNELVGGVGGEVGAITGATIGFGKRVESFHVCESCRWGFLEF